MQDVIDNDYLRLSPTLFRRDWPATGLDQAIGQIDPMALAAEFEALRRSAPRRAPVGKKYFVDHTGMVEGGATSNRREEHLAIAMWNLGRDWSRPGGGSFRVLDYQMPLKARQSDAKVGAVDLVGVSDCGRLLIIELKVPGKGGVVRESPPTALMEGLRYAAIAEANLDDIVGEGRQRFGVEIAKRPPIVQILAPATWWSVWLDRKAAGAWGQAFSRLICEVEKEIGIKIECFALEDTVVSYGSNGQIPHLEFVPAVHRVRLERD